MTRTEHENQRTKQWRKLNPERRKEIRARSYRKRRDHELKRATSYNSTNREVINARNRETNAINRAVEAGRSAFPAGFLLLKRAPAGERVTYRPYPSDKPFAHLKHTRAIAEVLPIQGEGYARPAWIALARTHITPAESATVRRLVLRLKRAREADGRL